MDFLSRLNYMKHAKSWVLFSLVLSVISVVSLLSVGLNKGIDFTGGTLMDVQFETKPSVGEVTEVVAKSTGVTPVVKATEAKGAANASATEFLVTIPTLDASAREKLVKDLEPLGAFKLIGEEHVSASVSNELTIRAALAIAIAAVLQIIYIWYRFQFRLGVTAVLALLHDLIITLGVMAVLRVEVNSAFVAAVLTILGYSINDTVVVFDRIRENLAKKKKTETLYDLSTRSIQEVIHRSLYTVMTVQIMLIAMLVWGGNSVWDFCMTLLIGVTSGAYSSIFIATALWLFWEERDEQVSKRPKMKPAKA